MHTLQFRNSGILSNKNCNLTITIIQHLELFDAQLDCLDVRAEVQFPLLLQLFLRVSQPNPNFVQVRVQLLPLLLILLCSHLLAEILSLQELPALNHS